MVIIGGARLPSRSKDGVASHPHAGTDRHAGAGGRWVAGCRGRLHRHPLHDLDIVAGGVLGGSGENAVPDAWCMLSTWPRMSAVWIDVDAATDWPGRMSLSCVSLKFAVTQI